MTKKMKRILARTPQVIFYSAAFALVWWGISATMISGDVNVIVSIITPPAVAGFIVWLIWGALYLSEEDNDEKEDII